jgi:S-DNA-T family DNA segregation ATPase FtsK/SpoIIIE
MFERFKPWGTRKRARGSGAAAASWLKPEVRWAIIGVILIVVGLIALLAFFNWAGPSGAALLSALRQVFGWVAYSIPFILLILGVGMVWPQFVSLETWRWVGAWLAVVGAAGLVHLSSLSTDEAFEGAVDGRGGGYLGFLVSYPLSLALSPIAAGIVFFASFVIGCLLAFNLSPYDVWLAITRPLRRSEEPFIEEGGGDVGVGASEPVPQFRVNTMSTGTAKPAPAQMQKQQQQEEQQKARARALLKSANKRYNPPSLDLLHTSVSRPDSSNVKENAQKIKRTLENFGISVAMGEVNVGPTVTQYTLRPEEGVKLSRITALQNDLALALAAHPIRIEAPIPKKNLVGIEIPNKDVSLVRLRDLLASKEFRKMESPLTFAVGKDVAGVTVVDSLERMPLMLIAGATGSGKSVCINTLLLSWLYRNSPSVVRLILVDPKRVELISYDGIPHLLTPVIVEPEKTINALRWAVREMDRRYRVLSESRARNLFSYNANHPQEALPLSVIVIDELADLMMKYARDVEGAIVRLSQMARAVGIHLVLATQRPSVNVITGLVKANIPSRIAFQVASQIDSRTILDAAGSEKLLGNGDMLFLSGETAKPRRIQGGFVSEEEVHRVVEMIKEQNQEEVSYDETIVAPAREVGGGGGDMGDDPLFEEAKQVVIQSGKASASLLQRRLRVGYARAARLLDMLQEQNIVNAGEGNKPREVLVRPDGDMAQDEDDVMETHGDHEEDKDIQRSGQW